MFLSSERGKRALNICYSWGASVVVIGAMFKLVHLPYANEILCVALITESIVFFISGFERPGSEYNWEEVFPVLKSKNPLDRPDFERGSGGSGGGGGGGGGTVIIGGTGIPGGIAPVAGNFEGSPIVAGGTAVAGGPIIAGSPIAAGGPIIAGGPVVAGGPIFAGSPAGGMPYPTPQESVNIGLSAMGLNVSEEDAKNLANSIQKLGAAAEQISRMADLTDATLSYIEQISTVTQNLERFNTVTGSLSEVSDSLVNSCKMITGTAQEDSGQQTAGYVQQMEKLNEKLSGLNQFYDVQLNGLRSQMETIHHINAGLNRIRDMYENSLVDSAAFRNENERMAQLLAQLNQVYGRLLQAMTVNMTYPGAGYPPQQPPYPNPMR
jgi:gliding motility-associated protein GldL